MFPSIIIKQHCDRVTKVGGRVMGATSCLDRAAAHWAALGCTRTYVPTGLLVKNCTSSYTMTALCSGAMALWIAIMAVA